MDGNTTTNCTDKDEKQVHAQGSSWGFLSWFKSNNPKPEKENPTASVKEQLKLEELEKLKRKGELLRAAQRREHERSLQYVVNSRQATPEESVVNEESTVDFMRKSSSSNSEEVLVKSVHKKMVHLDPSTDLAMSLPNQALETPEQLVGQYSPENLCLEVGGAKPDIQTLNENNTESLIGSVEEMSTATFEDRDCLTATDIEDFNFNELAKELQPGV